MNIKSSENSLKIDNVSYPKGMYYIEKFPNMIRLSSIYKRDFIEIVVSGTNINGAPAVSIEELEAFFIENGFNSGGGNGSGVTTEDLEKKVDKIDGKGLSTNDFTNEQKEKLANLEGTHFRGRYNSLNELNLIVGKSGDYAYLSAGETIEEYIWDASTSKWVIAVAQPTAETPVSVMQKYESNTDRKPLIPSEQSKLDNSVQNTLKVNGKELKNDINIGAEDILELNSLGGRNYVENGNFNKGVSRWGGSSVENVRIVEDSRFINTLAFTSKIITGGIVHFLIGDVMPQGETYTMSFYVKIPEDSLNDTSTLYAGFQGASNTYSKLVTVTKGWQKVIHTQVYEYGNNNPRFYGIGDFQIAEIQIEKGFIPTDFKLSLTDTEQPNTVFNQASNLTTFEFTNTEVYGKNSDNDYSLRSANVNSDSLITMSPILIYANSRFEINIRTTSARKMRLHADFTDINILTMKEYTSITHVNGKARVHFDLPANYAGKFEMIGYSGRVNTRIQFIVPSGQDNSTFAFAKPSLYRTLNKIEWSPSIRDIEDLQLRLNRLEAKLNP